ncbi:hypothetical protein AB9K34_02935 [Sedimentitalea sp. XS_ASV28]|uniref:hypothetical protein n=1 Tax=Sedimentitalea sp. XS_ASV28 TaxID=3241296 RepID=UPI003515A221
MKHISAALVALVVLTGQAIAMARGAPGPAGQIELCTGNGPVMVYVDDSGAPVGPPQLCPDFALSLLFDVPEPQSLERHVAHPRRLAPVRADLQNESVPRRMIRTRAPPRAS